MQFFDVIPGSGTKASVMTTPNGVIFSIPVDLAERAGLKKESYVRLQYGRDGDDQAVQLVPCTEPTAWKVQGRKAVIQIHAKQIKPKTDHPKANVEHQVGSGSLILSLPPSWDMPEDVVDQGSASRRRSK
jgi:hypothetical protein